MKWSELYEKIGKQPLTLMRQEDVYAVLVDLSTGQEREVPLKLVYTNEGRPYLTEE